ncbi:ras gtpase-activating protein with iq motif [Anaeramoeba flamelloides]|uniref:Ras gtpase-activating protein with iq motif n=1 Tax=Anaeramoeba flamelloides TaxID=1746091 RepID=A0ABQ8XTJ3_9EUKA|nr:ras gtpase-activating protein with iq motif [Anaeramoeba flamelloides]
MSQRSSLVKEIQQLQENLKQEQTCVEAEQNAVQLIKLKIEKLIKQLQTIEVENLILNHRMETLTVTKMEKSMKQNIDLMRGKVEFYPTLGCPLSTVQKNRYRRLLLLIRDNPEVIVESIHNVVGLRKEEIDCITHSALFSVYANMCNDEEENKFLLLLKDCIELEFKNSNLQSDQFIAQNKILARLLSAYTKSSSSYRFLVHSMRDVVLEVIQDNELDLVCFEFLFFY